MNIPTTLKHKPVFVVDNYENVDGYTAYDSEAKGLSLGLAQWNDRGRVDVSAKVWRYTGEKWSRQSEELPLHRVLDLALLLLEAKAYMAESYRPDKAYDPENPLLARIGMQGDAMSVAICTENPKIGQDLALMDQALRRDDELLSERMRLLATKLREMGY